MKKQVWMLAAAVLTASVIARPAAAQAAKPEAAAPKADASKIPVFKGRKFAVTPGANGNGARASTVMFNNNGTDSVQFAGTKGMSGGTYSVDAANNNIIWFAIGFEGPGTIRAFRWSWTVAAGGGGFSCTVLNTKPDFKCQDNGYNFSMKLAK